jgi:hypothetical protein
MTWNYRIIKEKNKEDLDPDVEDAYFFAIHEVYYDESKKPITCTEDPIYPSGTSLKELKSDLKHYLQALERPVLIMEELFINDQESDKTISDLFYEDKE